VWGRPWAAQSRVSSVTSAKSPVPDIIPLADVFSDKAINLFSRRYRHVTCSSGSWTRVPGLLADSRFGKARVL
jgi:hypothetical protein